MKKLPFKKRENKKPVPSRITNETVAEHRERILAGGRRFKYPIQYARHRLVFNTIIVTVAALVLLTLLGWWQLYPMQNTSTFFYRVTKVLPLPVASVDGAMVRYSDYLMYFNSSAHYLRQSEQINLDSEEGRRQLDYIKRKAMDTVIADTYAAKLAQELNITVDDAEVDAVIDEDRNTANGRISQETYDASALSILGWSPEEYRQDARNKLIRQKVSYEIDSNAKARADKAAQLLKKESNLQTIAKQLGGEGDLAVTVGASGMVPRTNRDGGLSIAAAQLEKGKISEAIRTTTGDGYYFVKLVDKTDTRVSYEYMKIPLTEFNNRLRTLREERRIQEFIAIPEIESQTTNQ
jgi:parvulin-like peptidyl-prolyl isomerase